MDLVRRYIAYDPAVTRDRKHAGVIASTVFHTRTDKWRLRDKQRHSLTLHVRPHEGAVRVVVFKEWDERRSNGDHLLWRYVHVLNAFFFNDKVFFPTTGVNLILNDHVVFIKLRVRLSDRELFFHVCRQIFDIIRNVAVVYLAVRRFNKAILVDAPVSRQRVDQTNVWTFRRFDRAHTAIVRVVNVAHFHARTLTRKPARPQRRETTLMRQLSQRIDLVHKLGQLRATEEFLDARNNRTDVDQTLWRNLIWILRRHALTHIALHTRQPNAELILQKLANTANATVTQMVDIVHRVALRPMHQRKHITISRQNIIQRQIFNMFVNVKTQLLVDLIASNLRQIVTLVVKEERIDQIACTLNRWRITRTQALVDLDQRLRLIRRRILFDRRHDHLIASEQIHDVIVVAIAQRTQKHRCRQLSRAVQTYIHHIVRIRFQLQPGPAVWDHRAAIERLTGRVDLTIVVNARASHQLADNYTFSPVDHKRTLFSHQREVPHENFLFFDLAALLVEQTHFNTQWCSIGGITVLAFLHTILWFTKTRRQKIELKRIGKVRDRRNLFKCFL